MKILFITRKFPPSVGGMELFAHDLSEALSKQTDLKIIKYGGSRRWTIFILPYLFLKALIELSTNRYDIIHVNDGLLSPMGVLLSRIFNRPFTVVIHGLDFTWSNWFYQKIIPRSVKKAKAVFCISQEVRKIVLSTYINPAKVHFVPLAIKDNLFNKISKSEAREKLSIDEDIPVILSVGRLVKRKGVSWFIENVLCDLIKTYPKLVFLVIGDGNEKLSIENLISKLNIDQNVRLLGKISGDKRVAAYNASDIFVMPNITVQGDIEGFGLVLLEASTCQLPIVASGIEGIKDAVADGKNAVLVPQSDSCSTIIEIRKFLDDKNYALTFGRVSRTYTLDNYSWQKVASSYVDTYKTLL